MTNNKYSTEQITLGELKEIANNTTIRKFKQIQLEFKFADVNIELSKRTSQTNNGETFVKREVSFYIGDLDEIEEFLIFHFITNCFLHLLLEDLPNLKYFKPTKTRDGLNTKYSVLPVPETEV